MEHQHGADSASTSSSSSPLINHETRAEAASSSSQSQDAHGVLIEREAAEDGHQRFYDYRNRELMEEQNEQPQRRFLGIPIGGHYISFDDNSVVRDDSWSCIIVIFTFWFFVSMTLILGVYGAENYVLGPYSSILIETNSLFVQSVKVTDLDDTVRPGLNLYGFYKSPTLNLEKDWCISRNSSVSYNSYKDWTYYLNTGSQIEITYSVSPAISSLILVIAEGDEIFSQWLEDPTYPNTTLSWNAISGNGSIYQRIYSSSTYYIAVANTNLENVKFQLDINVKSVVYDTSDAYYECNVGNGECGLDVSFPWGTYAVLDSQILPSESSQWYVKVTFGPRWTTYIVGIAGLTLIMMAMFNFLNQCRGEEYTAIPRGDAVVHEERPALVRRKEDSMSCGSSYESLSSDEKDLEEFLAASCTDGKKDGLNESDTRRLCAICYDGPRDCFFLPCGHCVCCFDCGTRISEAVGLCPLCRRTVKKVRKIFTV